MNVGSQVRHFRKKKKMSLLALSEATGLSQSLLRGIENSPDEPEDKILDLLCGVFEISIEELFKKRRSESSIVLTNEDLLLFKYLCESGFLTRDQIGCYIYAGKNKNYVRDRMTRLVKQGYIGKVKSPLGKLNETVLVPKRKAVDSLVVKRDVLGELKRNDLFKLSVVDPDEYSLSSFLDTRHLGHDSVLTGIRFVFEDLGAYEWLSQKLVYKKYKHTPDGMFVKKGKRFAVEYENNMKKVSTYHDYMNFYAKEKEIDFVIYVVSSEGIFKGISKLINPSFIVATAEGFKKFWLMKLGDVMAGNMVMVNPNYEKGNDLKKILAEQVI